MKIVKKLHDIGSFFRSLFLNGLFTIIPIALTVFVIKFTYDFAFRLLEPLREFGPESFHRMYGSEFIVVTVFILLLGFVLKIVIVHSVVHYFERLIVKIPFIRIVYSSAKMLVDFFRMSKKGNVKSREVVLITYPRPGNYHLAFLLEPADDSYQKIIPNHLKKTPDERFYKVFMPNSPNPTTGYFFILPESDLIHTNITFEEAVKTLVSCGLITPESLINYQPGEQQK
ncbi:DUF502 domain-containing protein [Candidatus Babeliales bacterium]|nr:DUF502 domain-containing protein [Candidatus Babeliales bacterium]